MSHPPPYTPIACRLHDELQLRALRRSHVVLRFRQPGDGTVPGDGAVLTRRARVVDVGTRDAAEYLVLEDGTEIRLDRLQEVDGIPFDRGC